ncbi:MAG: T9SS type A sorting domain-containing protein [Bacteroidetes bacterium]|nr:T9SS type A sorting domain-containing protein [Bacteroidota bacterium]
MKILFRSISFNLTLILAILSLQAENYYVDIPPAENGSGWNEVDGGEYVGLHGPGKGYATIQAAINAMNPGDIIYLRGGTYNETHISLTACRHGLAGSPNTIKSYPGEWAKVDGLYRDPAYFRPAVFWGTGGAGMSFWTFEDMEITGGGDSVNPPSGGEGILLEYLKNCTFRNLYIHHNHGRQSDPGATGGIRLIHPQNCLIEYCYFKANGNLNGEKNTGNAQLAMVADYSYEHPVNIQSAMTKNIIRYNLFDGDGAKSGQYTPIAIVHKGMQRLTGYTYGETENSSDSLPNSAIYREYGDDIHHNIIINSPYGMRIDQDYTQVHHNIIILSPKNDFNAGIGVLLRDESSSRRGPVFACVYNNLIKANGLQGINFRIIPDGYDSALLGTSVDYYRGYAVNNIIDNASIGYDWAPLSFEGSSLENCDAGEPLKLENFNVSRNLFYACAQGAQVVRFSNKDYTESEIEATVSADDVYKRDSDSPYRGTTGALCYKTISDYMLDNFLTMANGGLGGGHPYLPDVMISAYVGAADPGNDYWVDTILALENLGRATNVYETEQSDAPSRFLLSQNYPNPFNPNTVISYKLKVRSEVVLRIYDILGREIAVLVNEQKSAGTHTIEWNGNDSVGRQVGSGVYFYQLKCGNGSISTKKMLLIR